MNKYIEVRDIIWICVIVDIIVLVYICIVVGGNGRKRGLVYVVDNF